MSTDLAKAVDRIRQAATLPGPGEASRGAPSPVPFPAARAVLAAGDRVFDPATGQAGTVTRGTGFGATAMGVLEIRLDSGATVTRRPNAVIVRPR